MMKKRRRGHNRQERGRRAGPDPHLHDAVDMLQSVDTMKKKRRTGHNRQGRGRREGPDPHLHDAVGALQSVNIVVRDSDSFCQALLVALD